MPMSKSGFSWGKDLVDVAREVEPAEPRVVGQFDCFISLLLAVLDRAADEHGSSTVPSGRGFR